ncbi:MAG: cell surface protein SprA [Bacteroidaceae bacterium]|nr:cell surface protein SprA [Bacteroidaceae bacterium]
MLFVFSTVWAFAQTPTTPSPRWTVQKTVPVEMKDLDKKTSDLKTPENITEETAYNDSLGYYVVGSKIGSSYLNVPFFMTPEEYQMWSLKKSMSDFWKKKNEEEVATGGKEKFDFTDMHFDLGPAEKIFGPGGVRIKTQGTAELKLGGNIKKIDNPSLPIRNRNTFGVNFDEKINLSVNGKIGDKMDLNLNYNTDATFDFDTQNLKLKYEGKEDEIIKLLEGGNISFPSNNSLIQGASSLFGIRADMQFGRLKLQTVVSQKKSNSKSVSSKGGTQLTTFEIDAADYEENRHFFLSRYFRDKYDKAMASLPNIASGIKITRMEIWVTNKTGTTANSRNLVALSDLGEQELVGNPFWKILTPQPVPCNVANNEYEQMTTTYSGARSIDMVSSVLGTVPQLEAGIDYEKVESARLLSSGEYTINEALGYVSLHSTLQTDQVLGVAFEYTYNGKTYQVGEFSTDLTDVSQCLFVKSLKNTNNSPVYDNASTVKFSKGTWDFMMKNVYYLASNVEKEKFRLDIKYQSDTAGVYLTYIPEPQVKSTQLIKLLNCDRLDNNNKLHSNGYFDYVAGYTVADGRVFLPAAEPFGTFLYGVLTSQQHRIDPAIAAKYCYHELYDSIKTIAKQIAEKDKFVFMGQFKGTRANVISLGAYNVPQGSVIVTAGGVVLRENSDYTVDYSAGEVTIINQSIIDAGTNVNVSLESNTDYGQQRKTMVGLNWEYDFSKDFIIGGSIQHLSEQSMTTKVAMGSEPLKNTIWGLNINWKKESQLITNLLNYIPFLHVTRPSHISFNAEFAQLIAGIASGTQDNASYLDDFENTKNCINISTPSSWTLCSTPKLDLGNKYQQYYEDKTTLGNGYGRALMAWYNVDPLFTRRSSSLTPSHIKSDLDQLSNHYVREVYVHELFPNRDLSNYTGSTATLNIFNMAYYPTERGPYNFSSDINPDGSLQNPLQRWGGMMRKLETSDFKTANIEYVEFWMLDPFIYSKDSVDADEFGGDMYINLGEMSEDILRDGKKFYESGMPVDGSTVATLDKSQWGYIPHQSSVTYAFATTSGSRVLQDVGLNGLNDSQELSFDGYQQDLGNIQRKVNPDVWEKISKDPANDNYHYFRGSDLDAQEASILDRYKRINMPQGNSPDSDNRTENYDTSYKTGPDVEDINQDYTLNEYEKYYQYHVSVRPRDISTDNVGNNFIVDKRTTSVTLRNGKTETVTWYQFRVPVEQYEEKVGRINDFSSIRFMRVFLTNFKKPIVIRLGTFDLVRSEWRNYEQQLSSSANTGTIEASAVSIEENNDKEPVNYILPPGISRVVDPSQPQLTENNEQALNIIVKNMSHNEAKCVYKNTTLDLRNYKRLQMFVHANALKPNVTELKDGEMSVFVRLGNDYKSNYYEYEIPLTLTPEGRYDQYSSTDRALVWPQENLLDIPLAKFTSLKKSRNKDKAQGKAAYNIIYSDYDTDNPNNKISIIGNPTLGEVKTMIIGVRNNAMDTKAVEVWVNELRLLESNNEGGWAAQGTLNLQLSDFGSLNLAGRVETQGFGGLEQGQMDRSTDNYSRYDLTASFELGKFFPEKAKVTIPFYYSVTQEKTKPKYNPLDTDMELDDALEAMDSHEKDSVESIAVTNVTNRNISISNAKVGITTKRHPMPYDPGNFAFSYSHSHKYTTGKTTIYEREDNWRGAVNYSYTPVYKPFEPGKSIKGKSKWLRIVKEFGFNYIPQNISFNTEMKRDYYELQERDMENINDRLPVTFSEQFLWNRDFAMRWDITKNLHMNFQSATDAQIEEPYTPVNKDLYPDRYDAWKDSVWQSIGKWGTPLKYQQSFTASYQLPLDKLPIFEWLTADASYNASYNWSRGTELEDGTSLGNTINSTRTLNINGKLNFEKLYNLIPFLEKTNKRFAQAIRRPNNRSNARASQQALKKQTNTKKPAVFAKEIHLTDSTVEVSHGKKTKRIIVTAKTKDGNSYPVKYKVLDENKIRILNHDSINIKVSVAAKEPLENQTWYRVSQSVARVLMMARNASISYRNNYAMALPGFMPNIGNFFGQRSGNVLSPGLDFAFGFIDDSYIDKARDNGWLLCTDSIATPSTTSSSEDLQVRVTLEPFRDFKIDLNASRTMTRNKSIQYMYEGNPTTHSGMFSMTTISIGSAFEGMGSASDGYYSKTFEKFCQSLDRYQSLVEHQYLNAKYPKGTILEGKTFDPKNGTINKYSADVMVPAFLSAYCGGGSDLDFFPSIWRMLPNWTIRYSGLQKLKWFNERFKSVNVNHAYKSIYSVGSYSSFSSWLEYMGDLGFVTNASTSLPVPSSMYNISTVSINEAFSPLIGIDVTLQNNMTFKAEYKTTRVLNLSMTSVQINEATSKDWVFGMGYKINDIDLFGYKKSARKIAAKNKKGKNANNANGESTRTSTSNKGMNHDLNLRFDISLRNQATLVRDIANMESNASSGNKATKITFSADYTLSKLLTMSAYYDMQQNTPLLSSSSYPTTTHDFGISVKFSLTR